jgi:DNA-directed RNA polymerase specialized sigma24 family protein
MDHIFDIFMPPKIDINNPGRIWVMGELLPRNRGPAPVEPLKLLGPDGQPRKRHPNVEAELGWILTVPASERLRDVPRLHSESLVYMILRPVPGNEELQACLIQEAGKRLTAIVAGCTWRLRKKAVTEEIADEVETRILVLLVAKDPSAEFFELGFAEGVRSLTFNALRGYKRSAIGGHRGWYQTDEVGEDGKPMERPLELVAGSGPGPEAMVIDANLAERREVLLRNAFRYVKDPRQRKATKLHFGEDLSVKQLSRELGAPENTIKHWLKASLKVMRRVLKKEDDNDGRSLI